MQLTFPLSLGLWGRPGDSYRTIAADRADDKIIITLRHQKDRHLLGSVTLDTSREHITRYDTITDICRYTNIRPDTSYQH